MTMIASAGQAIDPQCAATAMFAESAEAGAATARFLARNRQAIAGLGDMLRAAPPAVIGTCARGSSDHAATYGKYLFETLLGIPVASAAPSVASVYAAVPRPAVAGRVVIAVSQSGRSPDLLATMAGFRQAGAHVVALVNDEASPLAEQADTLLPLAAGPERSVAATKSCLVAMAGFAAIAAAAAQDAALGDAVVALPDTLPRAFAADWDGAVDALAGAVNMFVLGRGYGFGIAQEAALKLKETCALHAEAFSAAEVRHGPMTIVGPGFPVFAFATSDHAGDAVRSAASDFAARGGTVLLADPRGGPGVLPAPSAHPAVEPLLMLQRFYKLANALSLRRGLDPDRPPHLAKVTRTL